MMMNYTPDFYMKRELGKKKKKKTIFAGMTFIV